MENLGKLLVISGLILAVIGLIFIFGQRFIWLGRLPGDIIIKKDNFTFCFPIATSIIISIILSLIFYIFSRR
ncbi:MAG: DUF2905 domain-containing protein [Deltaproteobacteria bacterium]|nr:DUF2905 domain-containing protein [Deltaproteobacteria bacterium]